MTDEMQDYLLTEKAKRQPHFILLAQDITADLMIDIWVMVNDYLQDCKGEGESIEDGIAFFRKQFDVPRMCFEEGLCSSKMKDAAYIAEEMRRYPRRKLAD